MPPSEAFIYEEITKKYSPTMIADMLVLIDQLLAAAPKKSQCEVEFLEGVCGKGGYCTTPATTFCRDCQRELCPGHAKVCCVEVRCPECHVSHVCAILAVQRMGVAHA